MAAATLRREGGWPCYIAATLHCIKEVLVTLRWWTGVDTGDEQGVGAGNRVHPLLITKVHGHLATASGTGRPGAYENLVCLLDQQCSLSNEKSLKAGRKVKVSGLRRSGSSRPINHWQCCHVEVLNGALWWYAAVTQLHSCHMTNHSYQVTNHTPY